MQIKTAVFLIVPALFLGAGCERFNSDHPADGSPSLTDSATNASVTETAGTASIDTSTTKFPTPDAECMPPATSDRDDLGCSAGSTVACNGKNVFDSGCAWKSYCDATRVLLLPEEAKPMEADKDHKVEYTVEINGKMIGPANYIFRAEDGVLIFPNGNGPGKDDAIAISARKIPVAASLALCE